MWKKTPPGLAAAFERAAPKDPRVVRKPMFGYPALFLNGHMFAGTFQDMVVVRLPEADREKAIAAGVTRFEPMPGRPMKEYIVIPAVDVSRPAALASWLERARIHAGSLPAKTKPATSKPGAPAPKAIQKKTATKQT